ncbi:VanZ family protein, partial [Acinetobacter baumannii]
ICTSEVNKKSPDNQKRYIRWLFVVLWMGVIFAFSAQPHSGAVTEKYFGSANVLIRKASHMSEYARLRALSRWAVFGTTNGAFIRRWLPF